MTTASAHLCFSMPGTVEFVLFVVRKAVRALDNEEPVLKIKAAVAAQHRLAANRVAAQLTDFVEGLVLDRFSTRLELTLTDVDAPQPSIGKAEDLYDLQLCVQAGELPGEDGASIPVSLDTSLNVLDLVFPGCDIGEATARSDACGECPACRAACVELLRAGFEAVKRAAVEVGSVEVLVKTLKRAREQRCQLAVPAV